ncbi:MobF family relaxase [Streptomyces sp. NPDC086023]|uniref:MobF family relaxase n=1 Tax=Streptomyces sp. NPDC086023 TaxID=3365746 RepID=UPI0037D98311
MGYATPLYAPEQVEYRLAENCGCDRDADAQVEYRLGGESTLRWIGSGLAELGLVAGEGVEPEVARALMDGRDWRTGERLVTRKRVLDPRGKVVARVLVDAVAAAAEEAGRDVAAYLGRPALAARFARAERGILRDGEQHLIPLADAERLAAAAGLSVEGLYGADVLAEARRWTGRHIDVGLRGVDITLDLPKSVSAAYGLAPDALAGQIEEAWLASVGEAVAALEEWAAYGMTGHHGDGRQAQRIATSGLLGWTTLHRSARPVDGSPGDPHLHVHVNLAHLARCADGKWRTIAGGGEDLHRYAHVINEIAEARLRARLIEDHGASFERSERTGAWELSGIDEYVRTAFSRRHEQVVGLAGEGATREQQKAAARKTAEAKVEDPQGASRESWRTRAAAVLGGEDAVDAMVASALPGRGGPAGLSSGPSGPRMPGPDEIAVQIWDAEHGLTASRKTVSHTHVMAAVAKTLPYLRSVEQLTALTDEVLAIRGHAVRLPDSNRAHHTHRQRYTHTTVVAAEQTVVECASAGMERRLAQLTAEAAEMTLGAAEIANSTDGRPFSFSAEQRAVVMRLLTAGYGVDAVIGVAGAGKTTLMQAARTGWEAAGLRVAGASTAAVAAANLEAEAGIESRTIAAWTREISGGRGLQGVGVVVIEEAAMVDDRALAVLLRHAAATSTKVVAIGDPLQLRAVGVGGAFARAHRVVGGLRLTENRRQRDLEERAALREWRDGGRTSALATFARNGRVHAEDSATDTLAAMLGAWNEARGRWAGDPHGQVAELLLLAARRADVEALNAGARAVRVAAGEIGVGRTYAVAGGKRLAFAAGDLVHIRRNDYRSRRDASAVDVLNGFRGVVLEVDERHGVLVQWRRPRPTGGYRLHEAWMSALDIAQGRLTHAYAMTIGSAQGLTAEVAISYGLHADSHTLYPAMSRARQESHLYLPLEELEDHPTRVRLGPVRSATERLDRAVAAYGRLLEADGDDRMVSDELTGSRAAGVVRAEPAFTPWRQRLHGRPSVQRLEERAAEERAAAERAAALAERHEQQADRQQALLDAAPTPGAAFAAEAYGLLGRAGELARNAQEEAARKAAAERHAESVRRIKERIDQSAGKPRMALRLAGTSRQEIQALSAQYAGQYEAALAEAQRADRAAGERVREAWQAVASHPKAAVLAEGVTAPVRNAGSLRAALDALRERVPVLAARLDASVAEEAQGHRTAAEAHRATAERHRGTETELRGELALRERMRTTAPARHARENEERAAAAGETPGPRPAPAPVPSALPAVRQQLPSQSQPPQAWRPGT